MRFRKYKAHFIELGSGRFDADLDKNAIIKGEKLNVNIQALPKERMEYKQRGDIIIFIDGKFSFWRNFMLGTGIIGYSEKVALDIPDLPEGRHVMEVYIGLAQVGDTSKGWEIRYCSGISEAIWAKYPELKPLNKFLLGTRHATEYDRNYTRLFSCDLLLNMSIGKTSYDDEYWLSSSLNLKELYENTGRNPYDLIPYNFKARITKDFYIMPTVAPEAMPPEEIPPEEAVPPAKIPWPWLAIGGGALAIIYSLLKKKA